MRELPDLKAAANKQAREILRVVAVALEQPNPSAFLHAVVDQLERKT